MIFHSSADNHFYKLFYNIFYGSIKKNYKECSLSFNYVGNETVDTVLTNINTFDNKNQNDIENKYNAKAQGYYALSRWLSIPIQEDHVCVCDIDLIMTNPVPLDFCEEKFKTNEVINITRIKPNGKPGGMMAMILRKDICEEVRNYSNSLLHTEQLKWSLDVKVRSYLYQNFNVLDVLKMQNLSKRSYKKTDDWFAFSKINEGLKLKNVYDEIYG